MLLQLIPQRRLSLEPGRKFIVQAEPSVVIVEDDDAMRRALERLLGAAGFRTGSFASAEEFLAFTPPPQPDCLVIDVCLSGMSGFHLHERLTQLGSRVPVIYISAWDTPDTRQKSTDLNAAGFLPKPFRGQTLLSTIRRNIGGVT